MMTERILIRQAEAKDTLALSHFLSYAPYIHRHLDWQSPLDWLSDQPEGFWLLERENEILSVLAMPVDPLNTAWVHLFATTNLLSPSEAWQTLFPAAFQSLREQFRPDIVSLALHSWFIRVLKENGFRHHQDIVVLSWRNRPLPPFEPDDRLTIRAMLPEDIHAVWQVDAAAFDSIWRTSESSFALAYKQGAYKTVAEWNGQIVGYSLSTASPYSAHLARLAVLPGFQGRRIGLSLVLDLLAFAKKNDLWQFTVNTQQDNLHSLHLYQKTGFELTGESFPVFLYPR